MEGATPAPETAPATSAPSSGGGAAAPAAGEGTFAPAAGSDPAATTPDYNWDAWTPEAEVPETYRPGVSRVRAHYEEQLKRHEQDVKDLRAFMLGETEENPFVPRTSYDKDLQRLQELEAQSSTWTQEKQELTEKLSKMPDPEKLREDIRQELMGEVARYGEVEGQKLVDAFASSYLDSLPPAEAEAKTAAAIELIDGGVDADLALEATKLSAESFGDFKDLIEAGADPAKALAKVREIDGKRSRRPSVSAQLTSSSQRVSVLGNRNGEGAEAQKPPPGSARESFRRRLGMN